MGLAKGGLGSWPVLSLGVAWAWRVLGPGRPGVAWGDLEWPVLTWAGLDWPEVAGSVGGEGKGKAF